MEAIPNVPEGLRLRSYQREMFERSMKGNVIVAMDTGSGKTHVALLRIQEEAEKNGEKLSWFLAPTVALCEQQHKQIRENIPAIRTRLLLGSDNVDRWSEPHIWDCALENIQVVVSTYVVLEDALKHGFVKMAQLSLLVFDEAHHCSRRHSANRIMQDFYHPRKEKYGPDGVPHILGLTASPILRSRVKDLRVIEANLDAVSITPRVTRGELMKHVHHPELVELEFEVLGWDSVSTASTSLLTLKRLCEDYTGPLIYLPGTIGTWSILGTDHLDENSQQLFRFFRKAAYIFEELGSWAADFFIAESIKALELHLHASPDILVDTGRLNELFLLLNREDLRHFSCDNPIDTTMSPKAQRLLEFLAQRNHEECSTIVFVQQRVTASILCTLLSSHPATKDKFLCATFVGMASKSARKYGMTELLDLKAQRETLEEFRTQQKNLIVATEALEEGIDITACNLVICFSEPANVKSFIQRRGRARKQKSCFVILFPKGSRGGKVAQWKELEERLVRTYQEERQLIDQMRRIEAQKEFVPGKLTSSCAVITPADAPAHLHHFCQSLSSQSYVILTPLFKYENPAVDRQAQCAVPLIAATVDLPICLPQSLWHFRSKNVWWTEKAAMRDVAFQAYCALRAAGLLNENLLAMSRNIESEGEDFKGALGPITEAIHQWRPWTNLAERWETSIPHHSQIRLSDASQDGAEDLCMLMTLPVDIPALPPLRLFWNHITGFEVKFEECGRAVSTANKDIDLRRQAMRLIVQAHHSRPVADDRCDFVAIISPLKDDRNLSSWLDACQGKQSAVEACSNSSTPRGFVRCEQLSNIPHLFHSWNTKSTELQANTKLNCLPLPKRRNFIMSQRLQLSRTSVRPAEVLLLDDCTIDRLPMHYARFGMFIPVILRHIERYLVADQMRRTILSGKDFCSFQALGTALTAPSAAWATNYEELEFFGDTVLKYVVSFQLYCQFPLWHEAYLTTRRARLVSNQNLARSAIHRELDQFIMIDNVSGKSWPLPVLDPGPINPQDTRSLTSKLLADIVEALIGAAYLDTGLKGARELIELFIPEIPSTTPLKPLPEPDDLQRARRHVVEAEALIGYSFKNKAILLEALTHGSCQSNFQSPSWQRVEFLGDAVLDMVIVSFLASSHKMSHMSPAQMTRIKAALVNAQILGFLCIHVGIQEDATEIVQHGFQFSTEKTFTQRSLWQLMRFDDRDLARVLQTAVKRYANLHLDIIGSLEEGGTYPWLLLARLDPTKVFSDMIESIIGAIHVDDGGKLENCQVFARRIGLTAYMKRLVSGEVDLTHPKTVLARLVKDNNAEYISERELSSERGSTIYSCRILVGDRQIAHVTDCLSKDEATIVAALEAAECMMSSCPKSPVIDVAEMDVSDVTKA